MNPPDKSLRPRPLVRPGFLFSILVALGLLSLIANLLLPSLAGSRKPPLSQIIRNLRQIEIAKQMWASEHPATSGIPISEQDLLEYLAPRGSSNSSVQPVDSEIYTPNPIGTPAQAKLANPLSSRLPKGTLIRWTTNGEPEIQLPNPQGGTNEWQPLYPGANRAMPATAARSAP